MAWPSLSARTKTWISEVLTAADQHGQFDVIHDYINAALNATTGHAHTGGTSDGPLIPLTTSVTGILPVANGGTGASTLTGLLGIIYPIGTIYTTISSVNPATTFGFGTWVQFGSGKVLVGQDSGDTDFDTAEETGGSKNKDISHTHTIPNSAGLYTDGGGVDGGISRSTTSFSNIIGNAITSSSSGSATQSVMNPFIVVYFWKRTV